MKTWKDLSLFEKIMAVGSSVLAFGTTLFVFLWRAPKPKKKPLP